MKLRLFKGMLVGAAVLAAYTQIHSLPSQRPLPPATLPLDFRPVALPAAKPPLHLAGAWELEADDPRLSGLSALAIDGGRFLAVTDRGAAIRFDRPSAAHPSISLWDLRDGPGRFGKKWARDAESLARDPRGRGWWVGYEQHHSLWLYDRRIERPKAEIDLPRLRWGHNRGAEGLLAQDGALLVLAENGRNAVRIGQGGAQVLKLYAGAEVADAARGPDGSAWLLLRQKGLRGIGQSIAYLRKTHDGYMIGPSWPLPKKPFDNYEGMAIEPLSGGRWRFWLVTDDGHRVMARTLLVAVDLVLPVRPRHDKSPAKNAGLLRKPTVGTP